MYYFLLRRLWVGFLGYDTGVVSGAMELFERTAGRCAARAIVHRQQDCRRWCSAAACHRIWDESLSSWRGCRLHCRRADDGFAQRWRVLFGRCVVGLAVGLASSTVPLYLAELAPPSMRGLLVSVNNSCIVVGQVCAAIVDGLFSGVPQTGWRWMLGLGGIPSAIQLVGMLFLPESPRWLLSKGREAEARAVLRKLRRAERSPGRTRPASDSSPAANPAAAASGAPAQAAAPPCLVLDRS